MNIKFKYCNNYIFINMSTVGGVQKEEEENVNRLN